MSAVSLLVFGWIALHLSALVVACGTRFAADTKLETPTQLLFLLAMTAVAAAASVCEQIDITWAWSAITIVLMVITAVVDVRRVSEPATAPIGG